MRRPIATIVSILGFAFAFSYQNGAYALDGLFTVRNGGMHQGVISYSLKTTEGPATRLDASTKLEPIELGKQSR